MKTKLKAYIEEQRKRVIETYKLSNCEQCKNYLAGQMYALSQIYNIFCKN